MPPNDKRERPAEEWIMAAAMILGSSRNPANVADPMTHRVFAKTLFALAEALEDENCERYQAIYEEPVDR